MTKVNNEWEIEFDKLFSNKVLLGYESPTISLKDFISKTLQQQREEVIKKIKRAEMIAISPSGNPPYSIDWIDKNKLLQSLKEKK